MFKGGEEELGEGRAGREAGTYARKGLLLGVVDIPRQ